MKQTIFLFFGLLFTVISQAQVWHEGIVEGEGVRYEVIDPHAEWKHYEMVGDSVIVTKIRKGGDWLIVRNTNSDTAAVKESNQFNVACYLGNQIEDILCRHLSFEETSQLRAPKGWVTNEELERWKSLPKDDITFRNDEIWFYVRFGNVINKISQVAFGWYRHSFWMNFSPDRLYRIEQEIIANVKGTPYGIFQEFYGQKYEIRVTVHPTEVARKAGVYRKGSNDEKITVGD